MISTGEDTGGNYQQMTIPADLFISEYHLFREIMCSAKHDLEYKESAFSALTYVYLNIREDDPKLDICTTAFVALSDEFTRRKVIMLIDPRVH